MTTATLDLTRSPDRTRVRDGARAMGPVIVAYVPFALVVGAAIASSAAPWPAWAGTWLVYGGAAHLALLDVLAHGGGWMSAAAVGLLVNVRLTAYAAAMAPAWRSEPTWRRMAAAVMLTDAPWALARDRARNAPSYYLGAALVLFIAWPSMVTVGTLVGSHVQAVPFTDLLTPLTLGSVVVPQLRHRPVVAAIGAAAVTAVLTSQMAAGPALLLAGSVGAAAGLLAERAR